MAMTPDETNRLYRGACQSKGRVPNQEQGRSWHRTLRSFDTRDVEAALDAWNASTERDSKGDLKSKWLPAPGELKPLVLAAQSKRESAAREPEDLLCLSCEGPVPHRFTSFIRRSAVPDLDRRRCRSCGAKLRVEKREAA
ncbi:MAG TPA: hypothetical protein VFB43_14860 [Terracidiphilus sp.]|nr:hypothetical protein [Terracidiphilus sp.]